MDVLELSDRQPARCTDFGTDGAVSMPRPRPSLELAQKRDDKARDIFHRLINKLSILARLNPASARGVLSVLITVEENIERVLAFMRASGRAGVEG